MREEYDFTPAELRKGIHGQFAARYKEGVKPINPDVYEIVPEVDAMIQKEAAPLHGRVDSSLVPRSE